LNVVVITFAKVLSCRAAKITINAAPWTVRMRERRERWTGLCWDVQMTTRQAVAVEEDQTARGL
jgi:hypothetical protein